MHVPEVVRVVHDGRQNVSLNLEVAQEDRKVVECEWVEETRGRCVGDVADGFELLKSIEILQFMQQPSVNGCEHSATIFHRLLQLSVVPDDVRQARCYLLEEETLCQQSASRLKSK